MAIAEACLSVLLLQVGYAPAVMVLSATGEDRSGLPVAVPHSDAARYENALTRGYASRLLRLYRMEQWFTGRREGSLQPGVLLLSDRQGGFPRWGLHLDSPQPALAYVDLHRNSVPSGRPGAIDQIFPHELMHIIVRDLAGVPPRSYASQIHAVGVKTDRITAFNEGIAEHAQLMAIDDEGADPATRRIAWDVPMRDQAFRQFADYRAALASRLRVAPKAQMLFPVWFSRAEQVLRYHAVKANLFAREPDIPRHLYSSDGAYAAYLLENTLPGLSDGRSKGLSRLLATEGVVAALFYRLVTDDVVQGAYRPRQFYADFGTDPAAVDGLDNAYLKLFAAIKAGGYDTSAVLGAYCRMFPDERDALVRISIDVLFRDAFEPPQEIWVLNEYALIGTSLFDQFRSLARPHTFDLNAATLADLVAVTGVSIALAERIVHGGPYSSIQDLLNVDGLSPALAERFQDMRIAILHPPEPGSAIEGELTIGRILRPYAWRACWVWMVCAGVGAMLYRLLRRLPWWRLMLNGLAASAAALIAGWSLDTGTGMIAFLTPLALFALPGSIVRGARTRSVRESGLVILAWAAAAVAAVLAVTPIP